MIFLSDLVCRLSVINALRSVSYSKKLKVKLTYTVGEIFSTFSPINHI